MEDTKDRLLPGTMSTYLVHGEKGFAKIKELLDATGGLSLSQVCAVTGLEGSTIQNWVKRGWVAHPKGKKYQEIHIARILIINALKDCIKLENIARLMTYVDGVRESELFNYLCEALQNLGQANDLSRGGIESVVETVIKNYNDPEPGAHMRIRKALTVMIFACVCTDVKRRTEAMMGQVLYELDNPDSAAEAAVSETIQETVGGEGEIPANAEPEAKEEVPVVREEARKTVAQAIREWDLTRIEDIINENNEDDLSAKKEDAPANVGPAIARPVIASPAVASSAAVGPMITTDSAAASPADTIPAVATPETATPVVTSPEEKQSPSATAEKPAQKPWYFRRN